MVNKKEILGMTIINVYNKTIGGGHPVFIIAEAGVNHNGSLDLAKEMIDAAVQAKVDAVKFQTYKTEDLILSNVEKAYYQKRTMGEGETQTEMLKRLEIDKDFHLALIQYCEEKNVMFLSTCYEEESLNLIIDLGIPAIKIASTDTTNLLLLEKVARKGKPVILSTGMSSKDEIEQAYKCLKENGCKDIALLKCTSNYPTELKDVNLKAMQTMIQSFNAVIGFSDHTRGVGATPYAVAMGAKIVEKHFTLDKSMEGPDHQASLSPEELKEWVEEIRKVEKMLGTVELMPTKDEEETKKALQKCFVSSVNLKKGDILKSENINAKRTGGKGIPASKYYEILGMNVLNDISENRIIEWKDLKKK